MEPPPEGDVPGEPVLGPELPGDEPPGRRLIGSSASGGRALTLGAAGARSALSRPFQADRGADQYPISRRHGSLRRSLQTDAARTGRRSAAAGRGFAPLNAGSVLAVVVRAAGGFRGAGTSRSVAGASPRPPGGTSPASGARGIRGSGEETVLHQGFQALAGLGAAVVLL